MGKRYKRLFDHVVTMDNLRAAYALTCRGKRATYACLEYKEQAEARLAELQAQLIAGTYRPEPPREFMVYEPKERKISALAFADRVAQHALHRVIGPIFDRVLMGRCYACRDGRGTHAGVRAVQAELRQLGRAAAADGRPGEVYFLKTDFRQYFASVQLARLWEEIERKVSCRRTLDLIERFTPREGVGLPIGNLTSQLWANVYGHIFDRWLVQEQVVLGTSWKTLAGLLRKAEVFARDAMGLRLSKWMVAHQERGVNFLGCRIWPTHKLLRRSSVTRARRKLRHFARHGDASGRERFLGAWLGHAGWADTYNLRRALGLEVMQEATL